MLYNTSIIKELFESWESFKENRKNRYLEYITKIKVKLLHTIKICNLLLMKF